MTERPFTEETLALLLHLRLAQLLLGDMKDTKSQIPDINRMRKLAKEVFQKIDWFCEVANKIMKGELKPIEAEWDDRLASISNITRFIATHPGDLTADVDFITSSAAKREFFWQCWCEAQYASVNYGGPKDQFNHWYDKTFKSLQTSNNGPIQ